MLRLALFALTALSTLTACKEEVACTTEARASVQLSVVDQNGAPLVPNEVLFTVDGGAAQSAECLDGGAGCSEFVLGWEQAGHYTISATYEAENTTDPCCTFYDNQDAEVDVEMTEDGCHVETELVTIALDTTAMDCADTGMDCG